MSPSRRMTRIVLFCLFIFLTLPYLTFLAFSVPGLRPLLIVDMGVRSIPLFAAVQVDQFFLDGGELTPDVMPLWVVLTGVLLWPLLFLGIRPALWQARRWRRGILAYTACAVVATVTAARWVFTHLGYFF